MLSTRINKSNRRIVALCISSFLLFVPQVRATDWATTVQQVKWEFDDKSSSLNAHIKSHSGIYGLRVSGDLQTGQDLFVDFTFRGKTVLRQAAHPKSAFVVVEDTLYWADFSPTASGCQLQSYSLETGKQQWSTKLTGLGPISHSQYLNAVRVEAREDTIWVWSHESSGDYLEVVAQSSGKTLANRVFQK